VTALRQVTPAAAGVTRGRRSTLRRVKTLTRVLAVAALVLLVAAVVVVVRGGGSHAQPAPVVAAAATPAPRASAHATRRTRAKKKAPAIPAAPADVRGTAARRMAIPILMYHVVTAAPPGTANPELWVPRETFDAELRALRDAGYYAITLRQAFDAWQDGGPLPRKPIVISFDDGYLSQYTHAKPALRKLGWPGVLNLEVKNVGSGGLTEHQVRSMLAAGWEVDSHTITHPDLTTVGDAQLRTELVDSRRDLRRDFGSKVAEFFCYPAGRYDARVVAAVKAAGYRGATTTDEGDGVAGEPYTLKRIRVNASDTPSALLERIRAAAA